MVFIIKGNNKDIEHKYILRTPKERFKNLKSQKSLKFFKNLKSQKVWNFQKENLQGLKQR